ncbi:MAG: GNAT family N-acetyltransferase [Oscillospiraceae bacterium]|nr:GNAT family N-acetyltransferase [Oscillospiraceae bacterium]
MTPEERILALERACFAQPWQSVTLTEHSVYVVEDYGYALGVHVGGEYELLRLCVLPDERGQGKGRSLLERFMNNCNGVVFLEVASRNVHAVRLYEQCGFVENGRRKAYYGDDDAVCYRTVYQ